MLVPVAPSGKESACRCRRLRRCRFDPWVRKIPWSGKWNPIPVIFPGKFHGQRSLAGCSPQAAKWWTWLSDWAYTHISSVFDFLRILILFSIVSIPVYNPTAAAAKLLQSCPTLCNAIDGSPPGSPVPGILQARTLEWVAISFSNPWKWKVKVKLTSSIQSTSMPAFVMSCSFFTF